MGNSVIRLMLENVIDTDCFLCLMRTQAIQNLAMIRWKQNYSEPLDIGQVNLFLCGSPNAKLTEEQKQLVSSCRSKVNNCFLRVVFKIFLGNEMIDQKVIQNAEEYWRIFYTPSSAELPPLYRL